MWKNTDSASGTYQPLNEPRTAAVEAMDAMRTNDLRMTPPSGGTNGSVRIYPFWGRFQDVPPRFRSLVAYAFALLALATLIAAAVSAAGYPLGNVWVVLTLAAVAALAESPRPFKGGSIVEALT